MNESAMKQMFESLEKLDKTIHTAKSMLEDGANPSADLLRRMKTYEEILNKQKKLAKALCFYAQINEWEQVVRHVKIMNGLSQMMRDDALEVAYGVRREDLCESMNYHDC